jgi:hypothetical protein
MAKESTPETTESIRIRKHTKRNLARGFKAPFRLSSYAEYLAIVERGELCSSCRKRMKELAAWQDAAKEADE